MTEQEWLAASDPKPMLEFLRGETSERKLRLFACACCRRIWDLMEDERSKKAVEVAEKFSDGAVSEMERARAEEETPEGVNFSSPFRFEYWAAICSVFNLPPNEKVVGLHQEEYKVGRAYASATCAAEYSARARALRQGGDLAQKEVKSKERKDQCHLLRDIFGNPFRPVTLDPSWLSSNVTEIARTIYDDRAFDKMPILADALQDAGCDNEEVLNHCRGAGSHVRGCWIVDLLLAKV